MASICIPGVGTVVGGAILGAGLDAAIQYGDNGKVDVKQVMISGVVGLFQVLFRLQEQK